MLCITISKRENAVIRDESGKIVAKIRVSHGNPRQQCTIVIEAEEEVNVGREKLIPTHKKKDTATCHQCKGEIFGFASARYKNQEVFCTLECSDRFYGRIV